MARRVNQQASARATQVFLGGVGGGYSVGPTNTLLPLVPFRSGIGTFS